MVIMRPTSIVVAGGGTETASIRAAGGVEFANSTSLSLNGVFTSDFDDYMIVMRTKDATANFNFYARLRSAGTDVTTNYTRQSLNVDSTTITAGRSTDTAFRLKETGTTESGMVLHIYGPYLAQPTACRTVVVDSANTVKMYENANTHSLSTQYDSITMLSLNSAAFTGQLTVFGLAQ